MKSIKEQLSTNKKQIDLMTHVVVGFPTLTASSKIVQMMEGNGSDFVELQIPSSKPYMDGPTLAQANEIAMTNGTTWENCFQSMQKLSVLVNIPLLFMCYYHSIAEIGIENFFHRAQESGAQGLIAPDIPEGSDFFAHFIQLCQKYNLNYIPVLTPNSNEQEIEQKASNSRDFLYCTSRAGKTGAKNEIDLSGLAYLDHVRKKSILPIALGFGISKPEHISALIGVADIAVVGSAVIDLIAKEGIIAVPNYIQDLRLACE